MAASFRSAGTWSFTANNVASPFTTTPGAPAGVVPGDCLVCVCESRSITATVATPSGWTLVSGFPKRSGTASGGSIYVFVRTADGSASDTPSPVWTGQTTGTSGDASGAGLLAYIGIAPILDGTVQSSDLATQTTTSVIPAFTTGTDKSVVIGVCMKLLESAGQTSTVATFTERADNSTTSGTGHTIEVSDIFIASHGSSGTATVTWSATTSARALAVSLGLMAAVPEDFEADPIIGLFNTSLVAGAALVSALAVSAAQQQLNPQDDFPLVAQPAALADEGWLPPGPQAGISNASQPFYSSDEDVLYVPPQPVAFGSWSPPARPDPADPIVRYGFTGDDFVLVTATLPIDDDDISTIPPPQQPWTWQQPWFSGEEWPTPPAAVVTTDDGISTIPPPVDPWQWRQPWSADEQAGLRIVHEDEGNIPPPPQAPTSNLGIPPWINSVDEIPALTGPFVGAIGSFQSPPQVPLSVPVVQYRFTGDERFTPVQIITDDDPWVSGVAPEWGITTLPMPWSWDINDDLPLPPAPVVSDDDPWASGVAPEWGITTIPLPGFWEVEEWVPQQFIREDDAPWTAPPAAVWYNEVPNPWFDGDEIRPRVAVQLDDIGWIPPLPQKLGNIYPNPWDGVEERPRVTAIAVDDYYWQAPVIQPTQNGPIYLWVEEIPAGRLHGLMEDEGISTVVPPFNLQTNYGQNIVPNPSQWDDPGKLPTPVHIEDNGDTTSLYLLAGRLLRHAERPFLYQISQEDTFEIAPRFVPWPTQVILPPSSTTVTLPVSTSSVTLPDSATTVTVPPSTTTVTVSHFNV